MNIFKKIEAGFALVEMLVLIAIVGLLTFVALPARAAEVVVNGRIPSLIAHFDSVPGATALTLLTNTTINSTSSTALALPRDQDITFWVAAVAAGAGTSNVVVGLNLTGDGSTYSTTLPITLTTALTGTTAVYKPFQLSRTNFIGVTKLRWDQTVTTQTNGVTVSLSTSYVDYQ